MNGAVITALNEAETIGKLVKTLHLQGLAVCVVDDGSTDWTGTIAESYGAHIIRHETPQGIGKSLVEAWKYALSQGWEYTVQIDAGGSHDPDELYMFRLSASLDILIGSRFFSGSQYIGGFWWRKFGSKAVAWFCNFSTHAHITDWTSGYRVFSRKALEVLSNIHYITNMHTWQIEVLHAALQKELTIAEVPITYRAGESSLKLKTLFDLHKVLLVVLFS